MKQYIEPEMECVLFSTEDIITTSSDDNEPVVTVDPDEGMIV